MKTKKCIDCGQEKAGELSTHGLCAECAYIRQREAQKQIKNKSGPIYEKWKARIRASVE